MDVLLIFLTASSFVLHRASSAADTEGVLVSVIKGDSVTLNTGVAKKHDDRIKWYFNGVRIAQINGDPSKTCTDVKCNEGTETFRGRLKLDPQTGSLTITNTRTTDSGEYQLLITSSESDSEKIFSVSVRDGVSVMKGDSVTLNTGFAKKQDDRIKWYFNGVRIAQINGDPSKTCTDVQCNEGTERFRGRLKLDSKTGSLTITDIRTTDSGDYQLLITSSESDSEKIFSVSVRGVSAAELDAMKRKLVKEGESVTLDHSENKNPNDVMMWYFNGILVAEITGDQSKICTDVQCDERFRDRLKLDHQTGSLTIMNARNTDSGLYQVSKQTSSTSRRRRSISSVKNFEVTVTGSGPSPVAIAGMVAVVLLVFVAAVVGVIYYRHRRKNIEKEPGASVESPTSEKEIFLRT